MRRRSGAVVAALESKEISATGDVTTKDSSILWSVVLTAGSDAASLVVKDGSSGTTRLTLKAAANTSVGHTFAKGVLFTTGIHGTLTGTGPVADFEYD